MKLHTLQRSKGIISKSKRIGRGNGSGKGNYSTKGLKGQKARSGSTTRPFFEGGQTSIVQRIPKAKGFKRHFKLIKEVIIVNLGNLNADTRVVEGMEISKETLKSLGYIKTVKSCVKILGNGDWTKKVTFTDIDIYSKSAQEKIANPVAKKVEKSVEEKKAPAKKVEKSVEEKKAPAKKAEKIVEEKKTPAKKAPVKKAEKPVEAKKAPAKKTPAKKVEKK